MTASAWSLFFQWPQGGVWSNMIASVLWTAPAWLLAVFAWKHRRCAVLWCHRLGEHPVDGTLHKVCKRHHTLRHHLWVHAKHGEAHRLSGRLRFGESHAGVTNSIPVRDA